MQDNSTTVGETVHSFISLHRYVMYDDHGSSKDKMSNQLPVTVLNILKSYGMPFWHFGKTISD